MGKIEDVWSLGANEKHRHVSDFVSELCRKGIQYIFSKLNMCCGCWHSFISIFIVACCEEIEKRLFWKRNVKKKRVVFSVYW